MSGREPEELEKYLNGEISREQLPLELRRKADEFDRITAAFDRRPVSLPPYTRDLVMARVRRDSSSWARARAWMVTPWTVRVPRVAALALAAAVAFFILVRPGGTPTVPGSVSQGQVRAVTRFVYVAPQAKQVAVTGEFARWDRQGIAMRRQNDGAWFAEVELPPGVHQYVFIVDGVQWVPDPRAFSQVDDGFGQRNSVMLVLDPQAS